MIDVPWKKRRWEVGDLLIIGDDSYRVVGIYPGALNCVSLIALEPITERPGNAGGPPVNRMLTPEWILNAACLGGYVHHCTKVLQ